MPRSTSANVEGSQSFVPCTSLTESLSLDSSGTRLEIPIMSRYGCVQCCAEPAGASPTLQHISCVTAQHTQRQIPNRPKPIRSACLYVPISLRVLLSYWCERSAYAYASATAANNAVLPCRFVLIIARMNVHISTCEAVISQWSDVTPPASRARFVGKTITMRGLAVPSLRGNYAF